MGHFILIEIYLTAPFRW